MRLATWRSEMDPEFLRAAASYFGRGTCLALALGEYRESVEMDFLCAATADPRKGGVTRNGAGLP